MLIGAEIDCSQRDDGIFRSSFGITEAQERAVERRIREAVGVPVQLEADLAHVGRVEARVQ